MIGILARRRGAMTQQAAPSGNIPVTGLVWYPGTQIQSNGRPATNTAIAAATERVAAQSNKVLRVGAATDQNGNTLNCFLHQYDRDASGMSATGWIRRDQLIVGGEPVTLAADASHVAFTFAYPSGSGLTMTQEIIDQCFGAEWV